MKRELFIIALQLVAFWPVLRWYAARVTDSTDEVWGLVALLTILLFLFWKRAQGSITRNDSRLWNHQLFLPTLFVLLYAVTYPFLPPLGRACVAATALGITLSSLRFGRRFDAGLMGLMYLSLPLIPSLQFYGGYPLRVMVACLAAPLLRLAGFAVSQEGTCLNWAGQLIWIDAPCSGVRMLWVGLYLAFTLACLYELRFLKTLATVTAAFFIILAGNIFRAVALFYLEAGILKMPGWAHEYAGVVTFILVAGCIVWSTNLIRKESVYA